MATSLNFKMLYFIKKNWKHEKFDHYIDGYVACFVCQCV